LYWQLHHDQAILKGVKTPCCAILLLVLVTAGCTTTAPSEGQAWAASHPGPTPAPGTGVPPSAPPPAVDEADKQVAQAIRETLSSNAVLRMASRDVDFIIIKGIVTLQGKVADETQRTAIIDSISKLPGVDRVVDQLSIVPL